MNRVEEVWAKLNEAIIYKDERVGDWLPPDVAAPILEAYEAECRAQGVREMQAVCLKVAAEKGVLRFDDIANATARLLSSVPPESDKLAALRDALDAFLETVKVHGVKGRVNMTCGVKEWEQLQSRFGLAALEAPR
jgi:hypothetical protein